MTRLQSIRIPLRSVGVVGLCLTVDTGEVMVVFDVG